MDADLGATPWRLETFESLPSTSDLCIARARAGQPAGLAVLAGQQTAGRGSRGRRWQSPPGNLYLSVLLRPGDLVARAGLWSLLGAVALRDALAPFGDGLSLKWPNDVLCEGRKLAGILLDSEADAHGRLSWLVIGFGANLAVAPEGAASVPASPREVAASVMAGIDRYRRLDAAALRAAWLLHAHPLGTKLNFIHAGHDYTGAFAGIAEDGALLLQVGEEIRTFATGEVLQGPSMPPAAQPDRILKALP